MAQTQTLTVTPAGARAEVPVVPASEAKQRFAILLDAVRAGELRIISRHDRPEAVLVPFALYEALVRALPDPLALLRAEFEAQVAAMQRPAQRTATERLMAKTPAELGAAAVAAARRRD